MSRPSVRTVAGRRLELSSLDKVYFHRSDGNGAAITKGDVIDYYERIAEHMLPHVAGRPLVLQRFPDGVDGLGFYQKNTPEHTPDWIERVELDTADGGVTRYSVIRDAAGLVYLANTGAIVFHTLLSRSTAPERPVEVIFDLDPASSDLQPVRAAASELRTVLGGLGMSPRVKSSGSRGLHVIIDVGDESADFGLTRAFARRVAEEVADRGEFTLEFRKRERRGRLFLDILRNGPAAHAVAPYSLRPIAGAPVAVPLDWSEALGSGFGPQRITIGNVFRRLAQKPDPWSEVSEPTTNIADALDRLT